MKNKLLFSVFVYFIILTLLSLGFWQIYRLNWKLELIEQIENSLKNDPVELSNVEKKNYLRIKTSGDIDFDKQIYLYNLNDAGKPGFEVINPIKIGDENYLVNRGWIAFEKKDLPESRRDLPDGINLREVIESAKPTALLGASTVSGLFTHEILTRMGELNKNPIIMPLSNPTSRAECTAEAAANATEGRAIFSAGSPFDDVSRNGVTMVANQGNNLYVFPGLGLGSILVGSNYISDGMLNVAAEAIPKTLHDGAIRRRAIYPRIADIRNVSVKVAAAVMKQAVDEDRENRGGKIGHMISREGIEGLERYVRSSMYYPEYRPTVFSPGSGRGTL